MKKYFIPLIFLVGCKVSDNIAFNQKVSKRILISQSQNKNFANSAYWGRKEFISKFQKMIIAKSDTLFLIERIGEPDLEVWSNLWTSKRDVVYEYRRGSEIFKDTVLNYKLWNNRYKTNIERFDTTTIDKHKILGGYRTFITQVIRGKEVNTFYFYDSYSSLNINK